MSSELAAQPITKQLRSSLLRDVAPGTYRIEYHDSTHLQEGEWRPLLDVEVLGKAPSPLGVPNDSHVRYTIAPAAPSLPAKPPVTASTKAGKTGQQADAARVQADKVKQQIDKEQTKLRDILGQSLVRIGVLPAVIEPEVLKELDRLSRGRALVLVPDTNALSNGVLHHILRALARSQVWLLPVAVSLTTIQEHDRRLKSLVNNRADSNMSNALRSRSLINASLSLLERCRAHAQIIEVDPQLLRYLRPASPKAVDPDQGDVLEDRLLVEAIHATLGSMRTQAERRVVTSDVFLARVLRAEGVHTLSLQPQRLPSGPIPCVRYDPMARVFVGATLADLLGDLAHTFASVRLVDASEPKKTALVQFETYWDGKTAHDWQGECLLTTRRSTSTIVLSSALLPEAPLLKVLRIGGALLQGPASVEALRAQLPETEQPSEDVSRAACEVLVRTGFASITDGTLSAMDSLIALDAALSRGDLDGASALWSAGYAPYAALLDALRQRASLSFDDLPEVLQVATGGKPSKRACLNLVRMAISLGQSWPAENGIRNGGGRPSDNMAASTITRLVKENARDGLLGLAILLPMICDALQMSPWAVIVQLRRLLEANALPQFGLLPALGPGNLPHDTVSVVYGPLTDPKEEELPLDRIKIGDQLIYTVTWSSL